MVNSIIQQCLENSNSNSDTFKSLRSSLKNATWPSNKQELWRYSKLQWLNEPWTLIQNAIDDTPIDHYLSPYDISCAEFDLVSFQGQFAPNKIKGVKYFSNKTLKEDNITWSDDFFNQLGWLGLNDWASIDVEKGQEFDGQWHCILDHTKAWQNLKLNIHVKKDAHLRLKINLLSANAVTNLSLKVTVESGASCQILSWGSPQSKLIVDHQVDLKDRAEFRYDSMSFETGWCHERIDLLVGSYANAMLTGLLLPSRDQSDHKAIQVRHKAPGGQSMQKFYSVADANGLAAFHGRAIVDHEAPKTNARQLARALMLSKACEVYSRPELEIDIDDVQCQHGSSIGELDFKALFYLRSRGISLNDAKAMLINGFIEEVVCDLDRRVQPWVRNRIKLHAIGE